MPAAPAGGNASTRQKRANDASSTNRKPAKKVKPELSKEEKPAKRWKSLKDQVADGHNENALETCQKILRIDPESEHAKRTYIQLLLSLDRYGAASRFITKQGNTKDKWRFEDCYALYKLGRMQEAAALVKELRTEAMEHEPDGDTERTVDVLDAQIKYRLEQFSEAQTLYEDLLATAEPDGPEYADLNANLEACNQFIEFAQTIPSRLADLTSTQAENRMPTAEELEVTPVLPILMAHPALKARTKKTVKAKPIATTSTSQSSTSKAHLKKTKKGSVEKKKRTPKLPPSIAKLPQELRPAVDPERWLPKRERKGYAEVLAAKEREKEKRRLKARKKLEASMTQGAASGDQEASAVTNNAGKANNQLASKSKSKTKKKK